MTVKEQFNVAGLPTTWGIEKFKNWRPDFDALAVQRLKAAGAVILGKTNVPVGLGDWQSYNKIYGRRTTPGTLRAPPAGRPVARRPRWPRASCRWRWDRTSADRYVRRRISAVSAPTSPALI
jgi:hypothetical protein